MTTTPDGLSEQDHALYMRRALELASMGLGHTHTNPMVGAVLVCQGRVLGEGYHHRWGDPHAEVMAIRSVRQREQLPHATLYVTLEPCAHYGKTPPCAELIITSGIRHVVVAMLDPYPEVSGRGVAMLRSAGVRVDVGIIQSEAEALNAPFVSLWRRGRPYISLKWAESRDGYMDAPRESSDTPPVVFSSPYRQRIVHWERMAHEAILVGYRTALYDNPSLTNRYWRGRQPVRCVIDLRLELPSSLRMMTDGATPTYLLYDPEQATEPSTRPAPHVRYIPIALGEGLAHGVVQALGALGVQSLFVEGGGRTLQAFIDEGLYDHIEVERSPLVLGAGIPSPTVPVDR